VNSLSRQCHEKLERLFSALGSFQCFTVGFRVWRKKEKKDSENCCLLRTSKNEQFLLENRWLQRRGVLACLQILKSEGSVTESVFICQACTASRYN
jgi:hypothetical protein